MSKLVVIHPSLAGLSFELGANWITIGRADGNTFQLPEASVSGRHCEVQLRGEELVLRDLNSTNGTFVVREKITEAVLKPGATLRLGNVEVRFEVSASAVTNDGPKTPAPTSVTPSAPAPKTAAGAEPGRIFHVLFVDDSQAFLETFGAVCDELGNQSWKIHTATAADRALEILRQTEIDLVVLDIGMPMLDGIQLLGLINRRHPAVKIAVLTGLATEANRTACLSNGAELFLEKPVSPEGVRVAFNMLNELLLWTQRDGFSGTLRQVGLADVIQMECLGRQSLILEVRNARTRGQIFIEAGRIIHATAGKLTGEKAFQQLLALTGGQFQLQPFRSPPERTVAGTWEFLLMEAARVRDEKSAAALDSKDEVTQFIARGEDIVMVSATQNEWHPVTAPKTGNNPAGR